VTSSLWYQIGTTKHVDAICDQVIPIWNNLSKLAMLSHSEQTNCNKSTFTAFFTIETK